MKTVSFQQILKYLKCHLDINLITEGQEDTDYLVTFSVSGSLKDYIWMLQLKQR